MRWAELSYCLWILLDFFKFTKISWTFVVLLFGGFRELLVLFSSISIEFRLHNHVLPKPQDSGGRQSYCQPGALSLEQW